MSDREDLAKLIDPVAFSSADLRYAHEIGQHAALAAADRIVAAGWRPSQPTPADETVTDALLIIANTAPQDRGLEWRLARALLAERAARERERDHWRASRNGDGR